VSVVAVLSFLPGVVVAAMSTEESDSSRLDLAPICLR